MHKRICAIVSYNHSFTRLCGTECWCHVLGCNTGTKPYFSAV